MYTAVITWRRTDYHWQNPRCPELPAHAVWNGVHDGVDPKRVKREGPAHGLQLQRLQPILVSLSEEDLAQADVQRSSGNPVGQAAAEPGVASPPAASSGASAVQLGAASAAPPEAPVVAAQAMQQAFLSSLQTVDDVNVFLSCLSTVPEKLHAMLDGSAPERQAEILQRIDTLSHSAQHARRALAIGEPIVGAHHALQKLKATYQPLPQPPAHSHAAWTKGTNKHGLLRVLLPVGRVVETFRSVSDEDYARDHGVATALQNVSSAKAYHLKGGIAVEVDLAKVHPEVVAMKCIEVRLDYERVMERLQFHRVPLPERETKDAAKLAHRQQVIEGCRAWADYLLTEKRRQMNIEDPAIWPRMPHPWPIEDVLSMPVVIWISIGKHR